MRGRTLQVFLLLCGAVFLALHFVHLRADFPNHSPWNDWAKYTDEGWYGDAAIRHYLRGSWHLPGDFNPAAALPVWPLLEGLLFRFTGVGIVAARVLTCIVFAASVACCYVLLLIPMQRQSPADPRKPVFAAAAVALLASSPFAYAFSRIAILEPLLILWVLLALLVAYAVRLASSRGARIGCAMGLGAILALMIGTKTTAIFLLPAVVWMLWDSLAWKPARMFRMTAATAATAAVLCALYLLALLRGGFLRDFRYLFAANEYTGLTWTTVWPALGQVFADGMWIGALVYPLALLTIAGALFRPRVWRDAVFTSAVLWTAGYLAFMAYHANFQPRYYLVIAVPLMLVLVRGSMHLARWHSVALYGAVPLLLFVLLQQGHTTWSYVRHPDYSFQTAAERIEGIVESDPSHSHTVLSISGSNLSLMTGLPSICDDFGTMDLEDRIAAYKPGWFVTWNFVEDDKMLAMAKFYRLTRLAEFPALDDPERNVMIVYRLDAKEGVTPKRRRRTARALPTG